MTALLHVKGLKTPILWHCIWKLLGTNILIFSNLHCNDVSTTLTPIFKLLLYLLLIWDTKYRMQDKLPYKLHLPNKDGFLWIQGNPPNKMSLEKNVTWFYHHILVTLIPQNIISAIKCIKYAAFLSPLPSHLRWDKLPCHMDPLTKMSHVQFLHSSS